MLTTIKVHPMIDEDKAEVMKILLTTPEFTISEVEVAEELIDSYLEYGTSSGYHILVAEVALKPAGYICYGPTPLTDGTWDIHWLAVAPGSQRQGIGCTLLAAAEDSIRKTYGRLILIETSSRAEYERTRLFYCSQGYEAISRIPNFYAPGDDRLVFQKIPG